MQPQAEARLSGGDGADGWGRQRGLAENSAGPSLAGVTQQKGRPDVQAQITCRIICRNCSNKHQLVSCDVLTC